MINPSFSLEDANELDENIYETKFAGMYFLPHKIMPDERGFYAELSRIPEIETVTNETFKVEQLNLAKSVTNVARGFHAEEWNKLITVTAGTCFSALADIRPDSDTFGEVETFLFGRGENTVSGCLFVPEGIANSLCVVEGPVFYLYAVDKLYKDRDPTHDVAISLFDPDLAVQWPVPKEKMILSERDQKSITLREKYPEEFV